MNLTIKPAKGKRGGFLVLDREGKKPVVRGWFPTERGAQAFLSIIDRKQTPREPERMLKKRRRPSSDATADRFAIY